MNAQYKLLLAGLLCGAGMVAAAPEPESFARTVDGVTIYLGLTPTNAMSTADRNVMHHGLPPGELGRQHVTVALYDAGTGTRISDARVVAYLTSTGRSGSERVMEPMAIAGSTTFGTYLAMPGTGPYELRVEVRTPEPGAPIRRASFTVTTQR